MKIKVIAKTQNSKIVQIIGGPHDSCYEIINEKGETIAGNVIFKKSVREKAIAKLKEATNSEN